MTKQRWLDVAEVLDAFRGVPRLSLALAWGCSIYVGWWYMGLESPMTEQSVFAGLVATALAKTQDYYNQGGRKWQ